MAEDFYLDEDDVDEAVRGMRHTGGRMEDSFEALTSTLDRYVGCWGDDKIGMAFQGGYWDNCQKMLDGYREAGGNIDDGAKNLGECVEILLSVDKDTAKRIDTALTEQE